jgi:excisionase family DNA binding protein
MASNLIAMAEAARLLGVSVFTVRRLAETGDVKSVYVGARRLIPTTEIERIVAVGVGRPRTRRRRIVAKSGGGTR